jgi:hypothetical protein
VHNFLAMLHATIFQQSPFATFGPKRLIRDALAIPGTATFINGELAAVQLSADHPYAEGMVNLILGQRNGLASSTQEETLQDRKGLY